MSTLSEAFIKAYGRQQGIPAPHVSLSPSVSKAAPVRVDSTPAKRPAAAAVAFEPPSLETLQTYRGAANEAPLAGSPKGVAVTRTPAVEPLAAMAFRAESLEAALEVEQFDWPETSDRLREAAAEQLTAWMRQFAGSKSTFMVTSQRRGEGRSTVLLAVARHLALASQGAKVVLIDADFERPQLAQMLGVAVQIGWEDAFAGRQPLAEALVESTADRVTLLPLREAVSAKQVLANGARLTATLRSLKQHFDFVCLDAGPLADAGDLVQSAVFGPETGADRALLVRDLRQKEHEDNAALGRRLAQLGVAHWNLVENFVQAAA